MKTNFDSYFDCAIYDNNSPWIAQPFEAKLESIADDDVCKDELIDLQSSTELYSKFMSRNGDFLNFGVNWSKGFLCRARIESCHTFSNCLSV